ncbi:MAG: PIG-L family deacetylase [Ktedonobacteraceae bacterium]
MVKSILASFAHPDDELGCAALVARYRAEGGQATLICATNGDVGTVAEKYLEGYASIPELRQAELACASKAIGFSEVVTFGYRDSGMMGTADNENPSSLWQAPLEEVTRRVIEVMRRARPQIVITFNTFGAYGHPDHIKINQATVAAFQQLQSEPEHPQKLYYVTLPKNLIQLGLLLMRLQRKDPRKAGENGDVDLLAAVDALTTVTTKVATGRYLKHAWTASDCYPSQVHIPPFIRLIRPIASPILQGSTGLSRIYPKPRAGEPIERDLFENVTMSVAQAPLEA